MSTHVKRSQRAFSSSWFFVILHDRVMLCGNTKKEPFATVSSANVGMGWLRLVGSLKLQASFAKEPYKTDDILQKETCNFKEPTNRSHPIHVWSSAFVLGTVPLDRIRPTGLNQLCDSMWDHEEGALCNRVVFERWQGVATTSRLLKSIGLFCKRAL